MTSTLRRAPKSRYNRSEFCGRLDRPTHSSCFTCRHQSQRTCDLLHLTGSTRRTGGAVVVAVGQVGSGVQVPVDDQAARGAVVRPLAERDVVIDGATPGAHLRGRVVPRCDYQPGTIPLRLVLELAAHLVRRPSVDGAREAVVAGHVGGCQVFDHDYRLGSRQCRSELVQPVNPDACNPVPYLLVPEEGFEAVPAPFRFPGEGLLGVPRLPLQSLQPRAPL